VVVISDRLEQRLVLLETVLEIRWKKERLRMKPFLQSRFQQPVTINGISPCFREGLSRYTPFAGKRGSHCSQNIPASRRLQSSKKSSPTHKKISLKYRDVAPLVDTSCTLPRSPSNSFVPAAVHFGSPDGGGLAKKKRRRRCCQQYLSVCVPSRCVAVQE
jgi:hypothetical protein